MKRLTDKEYLKMCYDTAKNSEDPNTKTGAIIVDRDGYIRATGYNHFPYRATNFSMEEHCLPIVFNRRVEAAKKITWNRSGDYIDTKYPYVVHAETDCCINLLKINNSIEIDDSLTMYITLFPCDKCAQMIIESGIRKIVYADDKYHDAEFSQAARILLEACGVECVYIPLEEDEK